MLISINSRYSRRAKSQERDILTQGIPAQDAPMTAPDRLPSALQKKVWLQSGCDDDPHIFSLPPNTAGMAKTRSGPHIPQNVLQQAPAPARPQPGLPYPPTPPQPGPLSRALPVILPATAASQPMMLFVALPAQSMETSPAAPQPSVPYTTQYYRRKKQEREQKESLKRKYVRKTEVILCKKCNNERKPPSHLQYFGNWHCEETATEPFAERRAALQTRGYGKKRAHTED